MLSAFAPIASGDAAKIKTYVQVAPAKPGPGPVAGVLDLHCRRRGLDLVRVTTVEDNGTVAVAVLRNRLTGDEQALFLRIEPQAPHQVTGMGNVPFTPAATSVLTSEEAQLQQIGSHLKKLCDGEVFSGVMLIARDGKPVFSQAYGYADRDKKIANAVDRPFLLGSA